MKRVNEAVPEIGGGGERVVHHRGEDTRRTEIYVGIRTMCLELG